MTTLEASPAAVAERAPTPPRIVRPPRSIGQHVPFAVVGILLTLMLLRTWLTGGLPGGVDSGFLYSTLPLFGAYGASAFTIWLPVPFGQYQQYSVYWLLAMLMVVTHSAVVTYDAVALVLALTTLTVLYAFTYWLTKSRFAAAVAATLYGFSPLVVAQWLDGHLDMQVAIALGPLAVWMTLVVLRTGSRKAAVALGLCASALFLLTTGEAAYWLLPVGVLGVTEAVALGRDGRALARRTAIGGLIALGTFLAASAVQLVPLLAGAKAPFLSSSSSYYIESLAVHAKYSLSLASNVFGIPRELWLPASMHVGFAAFNSTAYAFYVAIILLLAASSVRTEHRRIAITLLALAVVAWLLASGPDGSAGGAYVFLYDHVPYFKFLRVPNRWLMVSAFAIAVTAGMGLSRLVEGRRLAGRSLDRSRPLLAALGLAAVCVALAVAQAGGVLARGLPTTSPPAAFTSTYAPLAKDPGDWRMLTTPYYQAWMNLGGRQHLGNYSTLLSDLGYISTYWTDHNNVGRGGWDPRAAQFAQYLYELVAQASNTHLAGLLGAATVKYVGLNPSPSTEVAPGQNGFFLRQRDFRVKAHHGAYTVLQNRDALPVAYVTPTFCVVAGGMDVLGDLSQDPGFSFSRTGLVFADQAAATGGRSELVHLVRDAGCVIEAPGGAQEMSVLTRASSVAQVTSLAPGAWLRTAVSPALDVAADPSTAVTAPPGAAVRWGTRSDGGVQRVFVRALLGPNEGTVRVLVDGRNVGAVSLTRSALLGYQWVETAPFRAAAGAEQVQLRPAGGDNQLVAVGIVPGARSPVWRAPGGTDVVRDVNYLEASLYRGHGRPVEIPSAPWFSVGAHVSSPRPGALYVPRTASGRTYFTLAQTEVRRRIDPSLPFGIDFRGTGRGEELYLNVFFSHRLYPTVSFRFLDTSTHLRRLFFSPELPSSVRALPNWGAVTGLSISTNSKTEITGPLSLDGPFLLATPADIGVKGRTPGGPATTTPASLVGDQRVGTSATLHHVGAGLLVFTQSYAPAWSLHGVRTATHTVGLGFANAYVVTSPARSATLEFTQAGLGRWATLGSVVAWLSGLGLLAAALWRRGARRRARRAARSAPSADGGAA